MATDEIKIVINADDKASGVLNNISKSSDKLGTAFKAMAGIGVAGLGAIGAIAVKTVSDYAAVEVANKKLENAVINVSKGTKQQVSDIKELTSALQKKGVVDADSLNVGVAQLSTFGLTTEMVKRLTPALADLTVNQSGVNATTADFEASANTMAKALNGQFGILEKSGIRFTEAQQKLIQFGTEEQRATALIEGFNQNLKYTNDVAMTTFEGKLTNLKNRLGDVSETIGEKLLPVILQLADRLIPIIEKVAVWIEKNPELTLTIAAVVAGIFALLTILGTLGIAVPLITTGIVAFGSALAFVAANPIVIIIAALVAMIAKVALAMKEVGGAKEFFRQTWDGIKIIFDETIGAIINKIEDFISAIDRAAAKFRSFLSTTGGGSLNPFSASFKLPGIPAFAQGGIVTGPTLAMVGEAGPEAIVPLNKAGALGGITINISGNSFLDHDAPRKMAAMIMDELKLELRI